MKNLLGKILILGILMLIIFIIFQTLSNSYTPTPQRFWEITSVDTVKYSRDPSRDPNIYKLIPKLVAEAAKLHVTHIAINTPYDEEFYPVLNAWVSEARKDGLKVWFRGNFSGWEGWFGYPSITSIDEHNKLTAAFIQKHPNLFQDGDIFTPLPEPENGGPGDPRNSSETPSDFNSNIVSSYNNCVSSFDKIGKKVMCGFFSTNADIANQILTPETIKDIGNIVVIDHYVDSPQKMQDEINLLTQKFPGAKIVLGEFGAPIPDINGDMTEKQQNDFVKSLLDVFVANRQSILGVNYWTLAGGSTKILSDTFTETQTFSTIANYYLPYQLTGKVTNSLGFNLGNITILDDKGNVLAVTNSSGEFSIMAKRNSIVSLRISQQGYKPFSLDILVTKSLQKLQDVNLQPDYTNIVYNTSLFIKNLISL